MDTLQERFPHLQCINNGYGRAGGSVTINSDDTLYNLHDGNLKPYGHGYCRCDGLLCLRDLHHSFVGRCRVDGSDAHDQLQRKRSHLP